MKQIEKTRAGSKGIAHAEPGPAGFSIDSVDVEELDGAFRKALRSVDFERHNPQPKKASSWKCFGRALYINFVTALKDAVEQTNLLDAGEFHRLLWLTIRLGGEQQFVAKSQHVAATVVSRWVTAKQTPDPIRRRQILEAALASLTKNIEAKEIVPMNPNLGERGSRQGAMILTDRPLPSGGQTSSKAHSPVSIVKGGTPP